MASVNLYNTEGKSIGQIELEPTLFDVKVNSELVHEAVVTQAANSRKVIAHAKDRSEVQGTTKKPWKQKGTGRARHGSRRSPLWSGGGVTFGPLKTRNFSRKMNTKARRKALAMVLSDKVANERFIAVEDLIATDGKTKNLIDSLSKLPLSGKKTLIVLQTENKEVARAAQNIQNVETIPVNSLNVIDLLRFENMLISKQGIENLTEIYKR